MNEATKWRRDHQNRITQSNFIEQYNFHIVTSTTNVISMDNGVLGKIKIKHLSRSFNIANSISYKTRIMRLQSAEEITKIGLPSQILLNYTFSYFHVHGWAM